MIHSQQTGQTEGGTEMSLKQRKASECSSDHSEILLLYQLQRTGWIAANTPGGMG